MWSRSWRSAWDRRAAPGGGAAWQPAGKAGCGGLPGANRAFPGSQRHAKPDMPGPDGICCGRV